MRRLLRQLISVAVATISLPCVAESKVQDMSDPLAVYTQLGLGYTDKGLNLKAGLSYDAGKENTMAMNIIEIKGLLGESLGVRDNLDNGADSVRFRNFKVNTSNGRGGQIDAIYNLNNKTGSASYSLIQALPKWGTVQLYPLAGLGLTVANNVSKHPLWSGDNAPSGFSVPGGFGMIGMYGKFGITDKIWLNYNPIWLKGIAGSDEYVNNTYGADKNEIFTHEAALSYQISPIMNLRYFANWADNLSFSDGDHRIEFNYQL